MRAWRVGFGRHRIFEPGNNGENGAMKFLGAVALSVLMVPAVACTHSVKVPQELVGNWVTDNAKYEGKNLIIDRDGYIVLILDPVSTPKASRVDSMQCKKEAGLTCLFETTNKTGTHDKISVNYRPVNGGELRLAHPNNVVWHHAPTE
jgi:hypothetical protein